MTMKISNRWHVIAVVATLMTLAVTTSVHAEAGINGRIFGLDEKGVPMGSLPGAKIEFKNAAGKVAGTGVSDGKGRYSVKLPPGTYNICVCLAWRSDIRIGMPGPCTPLFPLKVLK